MRKNQLIINLGKKVCLTGCPENNWNSELIKETYKPLVKMAENLIKANRNVNNLYPLDDIRDAAIRIRKAEQKLIIVLEEIGWENSFNH